ncbi:MAG: hypothetical protein MJ077_12025 [Oscillospiraceae bacterium]|nr:hypothetical protein [Oscillospiraceae bacterium]
MNLQNIVENRLSENPKPPLQRIEESLNEFKDWMSQDTMTLTVQQDKLLSLIKQQENSLAALKTSSAKQNQALSEEMTRLHGKLSQIQKDSSHLMSSSETVYAELTSTTQLALKTIRKNTVGWNFKLWLLLNSVFNIGTIIFVLYLILKT